MREITTHKIHHSDPGPFVKAEEELGPGGAPHRYTVSAPFGAHPENLTLNGDLEILFQHGGVPENGVNGVTIETLLAICIDRLEHFQAGNFACYENRIALGDMRHALGALHHRTRDRRLRGVEGREEP